MDKKVFFDIARGPRGRLKQSQVDGMNYLLDNAYKYLEKEDFLRKLAYILATVKHETIDSYQPIDELGKLQSKPYYPYYGRGYVQLTWRKNYQLAGEKLGVDFVQNPDWVKKPEYAIEILFRGMQEGWFTGKKLGDYIKTPSYEDDRRVVNGVDKSSLIAKYAIVFEEALVKSGYTLQTTEIITCPHCGSEKEEKIDLQPDHDNVPGVSELVKWVFSNWKWRL